MYAFNKRFRQNKFKGMPINVVVCAIGGVLFLAMAVMFGIGSKKPLIGFVMSMMAIYAFYFAYKFYIEMDSFRVTVPKKIGRIDKKSNEMIL